MRIAFIGMMGTGKTVTGQALAERLGSNFADVDNMIVARMGMPIAQVFITFGERIFRSYENDVLMEIVWHENIVVSCGGGVVLSKDNMEHLKDFVKVRLTASPEKIYERTKDDFSRPLLKDNSPFAIAKIIKEREESYSAYADITVDTTQRTIDEVVDIIIAQL